MLDRMGRNQQAKSGEMKSRKRSPGCMYVRRCRRERENIDAPRVGARHAAHMIFDHAISNPVRHQRAIRSNSTPSALGRSGQVRLAASEVEVDRKAGVHATTSHCFASSHIASTVAGQDVPNRQLLALLCLEAVLVPEPSISDGSMIVQELTQRIIATVVPTTARLGSLTVGRELSATYPLGC